MINLRAFVLAFALLPACGPVEGTLPEGRACIPGTTQLCVCPVGTGAQSCLPSGLGYSACVGTGCSAPLAGDAATVDASAPAADASPGPDVDPLPDSPFTPDVVAHAPDAAQDVQSARDTPPEATRPPAQYCGDGACTTAETCSNCPGDCGACREPYARCSTTAECALGFSCVAAYSGWQPSCTRLCPMGGTECAPAPAGSGTTIVCIRGANCILQCPTGSERCPAGTACTTVSTTTGQIRVCR